MKTKTKTILTLTALLFVFFGCNESDDGMEKLPMEDFTDREFKSYLLDNFDTDKDGIVSVAEAEAVTEMNIPNNALYLDGIQYFTQLKVLKCLNSQLSTLDLSKNINLEELDCSENNLSSLVLPETSKLKVVKCRNAFISLSPWSVNFTGEPVPALLDFSGNPMLETLDCSSNEGITSLDLTKCTELRYLNYSGCSVTTLDLGSCRGLKTLYCDNLENVTLSNIVKLDELNMSGSNHVKNLNLKDLNVAKLVCSRSSVSSIDVSDNTSIKEIYADDCSSLITFVAENSFLETVSLEIRNSSQLTLLNLKNCKNLKSLNLRFYDKYGIRMEGDVDLDISGCTTLTTLYINYLHSLNATGCTALKIINCYGMISSINVDKCSSLETLKFENSAISSPVNVSDCKALKVLRLHGSFADLDLSENTLLDSLTCSAPVTELKFGNLTKLKYLFLGGCSFSYFDISNNPTLEKLVLYGIKSDICTANALSLKSINCAGSEIRSLNVEGCKSLESLILSETDVELLNTEGCMNLKTFAISELHSLTSLDLSDIASLDSVYIKSTQIQSIKLNKNIRVLECRENLSLSSLNVDDYESLETLVCSRSALGSLSLNKCVSLKTLDCSDNEITSLNISACTGLISLSCFNNKLEGSLDVSMCRSLSTLNCQGNKDLGKLIVYKNHSITSLGKDTHTILDLID